jgi:hypothetical protein
MGEIRRRRFLKFGGVASTVATAGCLASAFGGGDTPGEESAGPTESKDALGLALAKSGPGSLAESDEVHSGWVHVVAHGETYDVTFDVRVCHRRGEVVTIDLGHAIGGEYVLAIATGEATDTRKTTSDPDTGSGCDFGTRIKGGGRLPNDFETLRVTADGRTIQTVENEGTVPILRPLPDPVDG